MIYPRKYRKRPVVIEAVLWDGREESLALVLYWAGGAMVKGDDLILPTLEGDMTASRGDYIIRGVKGEVYPCKPDIFQETYEGL